jgi:hypothetical protein
MLFKINNFLSTGHQKLNGLQISLEKRQAAASRFSKEF